MNEYAVIARELDERHLSAMLAMADQAIDLFPKMDVDQWMGNMVEVVAAFIGR